MKVKKTINLEMRDRYLGYDICRLLEIVTSTDIGTSQKVLNQANTNIVTPKMC